jgi:hypothetical protein
MLLLLATLLWENRRGYWHCFGLARKIIGLGNSVIISSNYTASSCVHQPSVVLNCSSSSYSAYQEL